MNYWALAIILLAIAMAVGPVMLMQPSGHSKRLARLRQEAAQLGLQVKMVRWESQEQKHSVAAYSLTTDQIPKSTPQCTLIRQNYAHGLHFHQCWDWSDKDSTQAKAKPNALDTQQFKAWLDQLPEDIVGFEVRSHQLGLWWRERSNISVEQIKLWLEEAMVFLSQ